MCNKLKKELDKKEKELLSIYKENLRLSDELIATKTKLLAANEFIRYTADICAKAEAGESIDFMQKIVDIKKQLIDYVYFYRHPEQMEDKVKELEREFVGEEENK